MKIVALGGCINKQKNLPEDRHYHYLLKRLLDKQAAVCCEVSTETYYNYFDLSGQIKDILSHGPDVIILFVRAFPLHPLIKPFIRYKANHERARTMLHPVFYQANIDRLKGTMTEHREPAAQPKRSTLHKLIAQANISAGRMLSIDKWALKYITDELYKINALCRAANVKFILAGPPRYPAYAPLDGFCMQLNAAIKSMSEEKTISHADISVQRNESEEYIFETNGYHLNQKGHSLLAAAIMKHL